MKEVNLWKIFTVLVYLCCKYLQYLLSVYSVLVNLLGDGWDLKWQGKSGLFSLQREHLLIFTVSVILNG